MKYLYRLWASLAGYFALPCPTCQREFYGFQHMECGSLNGRMICPRCTREGKGEDRDAMARQAIEGMIARGGISGLPIDQSQLTNMDRLQEPYLRNLKIERRTPQSGER